MRKFHKCTECAVANLAIVCGACGLRSIEETFHGPVKLRDVDDDHWLCVNRDALARLDAEPPIKLLNRDGKEVCVRRREIHNLLEVDPYRWRLKHRRQDGAHNGRNTSDHGSTRRRVLQQW